MTVRKKKDDTKKEVKKLPYRFVAVERPRRMSLTDYAANLEKEFNKLVEDDYQVQIQDFSDKGAILCGVIRPPRLAGLIPLGAISLGGNEDMIKDEKTQHLYDKMLKRLSDLPTFSDLKDVLPSISSYAAEKGKELTMEERRIAIGELEAYSKEHGAKCGDSECLRADLAKALSDALREADQVLVQ